ncbi:MAG: ATP-binding protein [Deltaproteobacteria bacterium]|nr:ATP-binding protein [Deltaproteobacteria bacterium]MBI3296121.1 ATP-binding protein [Deltaproteobacteria bacterium]
MIIHRYLTDIIEKSKKGVLLLGPRQTGKSTLIEGLKPDITINLAHEPTFLECAGNPSYLDERIGNVRNRSVFIDEVQRLPNILNTVQVIADAKRGIRFFLTGSSARKLKRGKANLLPGRVISYSLGPLLASEIGEGLVMKDVLSTGTLPGVFSDESQEERQRVLASYAATYLKEEIQAEGLTKDLEGFARFFRYSAAVANQFLDLSKLATAAQIKRPAAMRFFQLLEDTLIVFRLDSFAKSEKRRLVQHPRFFYFDNGVLNGVLRNFQVSVDRIGMLFEHFVISQIYHASLYHPTTTRLSSYRTEHGAEVDCILESSTGGVWAIEIKASQNIGPSDITGLNSFSEYYKKAHQKIIIYLGSTERTFRDIRIVPFHKALSNLFPTD